MLSPMLSLNSVNTGAGCDASQHMLFQAGMLTSDRPITPKAIYHAAKVQLRRPPSESHLRTPASLFRHASAGSGRGSAHDSDPVGHKRSEETTIYLIFRSVICTRPAVLWIR